MLLVEKKDVYVELESVVLVHIMQSLVSLLLLQMALLVPIMIVLCTIYKYLLS